MEYLYHVTLASNLPSIAEHGLLPGRGGSFGGGYAAHSTGKLFLADRDAVPCWWGKFRDLAFHHHEPEEILEQSYVPVVLRLPGWSIEDTYEDPLGTRDCIAGESGYVKTRILPDDIEVWAGGRWVDVGSADPEDVARAYVSQKEEVLESDDEDSWLDLDLDLPGRWEDAE